MPSGKVKGPETHRLLRRRLGPPLNEWGFKAMPGASRAAWARQEPSGSWATVVIQLSQWNGGPYAPNRLTVEIGLSPEPKLLANSRRRLGRYLAPDEWERWRRLRNAVAAKAERPPPSFLAQLGTMAHEFMKSFEPLSSVEPSLDLWMSYLSADDLEICAEFLEGVLDHAIPAAIDDMTAPGARPF